MNFINMCVESVDIMTADECVCEKRERGRVGESGLVRVCVCEG